MMAASQTEVAPSSKARVTNLSMPLASLSVPIENVSSQLRNRLILDPYTSPVNQNGSFEFDRVLKSGYVQKRTQKTKGWKPVYLVLRPNSLYIYRTDKEDKLRHKIHLSDLTAVALLRDPKQKNKNVFGLFSPERNYHLQATSLKDAQDWVDLVRSYARIEEEEEEMLLASPVIQRQPILEIPSAGVTAKDAVGRDHTPAALEAFASSSPEPLEHPTPRFSAAGKRAPPLMTESSGYSGNELVSHSDFSDNDTQRAPERLAVRSPAGTNSQSTQNGSVRPGLDHRNASQVSGINVEQDPDRVVWQGWLWLLRSKGGVRQWKNLWGVLRPRNLILYKDETEYSARFILQLSSIVNVVDIDPISRTKSHCLQIITEEKSYRFCAHGEESLVQCLGAFKSLFAKRRELEARVAVNGSKTAT